MVNLGGNYYSNMPKFRLNKRRLNPQNNHEVHNDTCRYYKTLTSYVDLGEFIFCSTAIQTARTLGFSDVDGCSECCKECHSG